MGRLTPYLLVAVLVLGSGLGLGLGISGAPKNPAVVVGSSAPSSGIRGRGPEAQVPRGSVAASPGPSAGTTFIDVGALRATVRYPEAKESFGPPPGRFSTLAVNPDGARVTAAQIIGAYETSTSPLAGFAGLSKWGPPFVAKASFTDLGQGPIDQASGRIVPTYDDTPVWIVYWKDIEFPPEASEGPDGGGESGPSDAYAIFTPTGRYLESIGMPTSCRPFGLQVCISTGGR